MARVSKRNPPRQGSAPSAPSTRSQSHEVSEPATPRRYTRASGRAPSEESDVSVLTQKRRSRRRREDAAPIALGALTPNPNPNPSRGRAQQQAPLIPHETKRLPTASSRALSELCPDRVSRTYNGRRGRFRRRRGRRRRPRRSSSRWARPRTSAQTQRFPPFRGRRICDIWHHG